MKKYGQELPIVALNLNIDDFDAPELKISRVYSNPSMNISVVLRDREKVGLLGELIREFLTIVNKIEIDLHNSHEDKEGHFTKK